MKTKLSLLTLLVGGITLTTAISPSLNSSMIESHSLNTSKSIMSGQEFVDDLNSLSSGDTYTLESDVDLSDLSMATEVDPLDNITIEGNYHTISNRSLNDSIDLTNLGSGVYLFKSIEDSIINNLVFDNVPFVFQSVSNSNLNNVNFINTHIDQKTINTTGSSVFTESGAVTTTATGIGLFIEYFANSSWTNSVIQNISFNDNVIENKVSTSFIGTIFLSPIGYIKEEKKTSSTDTTNPNEFKNIFIDDLSYENNIFQGKDLSAKTATTSEDYGNASSIYFSPLFAASLGYKTNDSYAVINVDNLVVNNLSYLNNTSTITNNTINTYGRGQGIFYSLNPAYIVGTQLTINQSYLFNLNINNDQDSETLINTGYVNTLNNYSAPSKGFTVTNSAYYYQDQNLIDYNGFDSTIYKYTDYQTMIDSIQIGNVATRNNLIWDANLWEIKQLTSDQDPTLYMHYDLWFSDVDFRFDIQNSIFTAVFRTGNFEQGTWNISIDSGNNSISRNYKSGQNVKEILVTDIIFDPTTNLTLTFNQNDVSYTKQIDTSYFIPKITRVYNDVISNKLEISIDFDNHFGYDLAFDINLYQGNNLVEKFEKQLINPSLNDNNITFTSSTDFSTNTDYSDYYLDVKIDYATDGQNWNRIYDGIINFDDSSLISYQHYQAPTNVLLIVLMVLLIIFLVAIVLIVIIILKRKSKASQMIALYEEVTGIAEFEEYV